MNESSEVAASNRFVCDLCGVVACSEVTLNCHLRGRQHQFNLDKRDAAERSVYVRGFPVPSTQQDLDELFKQFGKVKRLWMSGHGIYAIVEFADEVSARRVLQFSKPLLLHGKKLTVKPRDLKQHTRTPKSTSQSQPKSKVQRQAVKSPSPSFEEQLKLDPEIMHKLSTAKSADEEIKLISSHYKMPMSAVEAHLSICKQLQDRLQANFPDCMVVPFGAAISGHGTITSDCDICLLTEPTPQEQALFSGTSYHPILLDQQPNEEQELPQAVDSDPRMDDSFTSSSEASSTANSPSYFPHHTTSSSDRSNLQTFNAVTSCVRTIPHCSKVFAIPHARCPIVRFNFQPQGIHCDLSINNMLGPANTRLMQAYNAFDRRFSDLVPFVRIWVKFSGIPRGQLTNYAVSTMLIYSLQRCQPPVLPCLQNPCSWPKNMAWFGKLGFAAPNHTQSFDVGPWKCDFVAPESLLPSTNTQSIADLLLHFFKYYSEWKGDEVVAIHCPLDKTLSPSEAKALAAHPQTIGFKVKPLRDASPLIIQDPFELDHNLCKALSKANFASFIRHMKIAGEILASSGSVLALFDRKEYEQLRVKIFGNDRSQLVLSMRSVVLLLQKQGPPFSILAEWIDQLDPTNSSVHESLSRVVLRAVATYLHNKFDFISTPSNLSKNESLTSSEPHPSGGQSVMLHPLDSTELATPRPHPSDSHDPQPVQPTIHGDDQPTQHAGATLHVSNSSIPHSSDSGEKRVLTGHKRALSSDSDDFDSDELASDDTKRVKNTFEEVTALDVLRHVQQGCHSNEYTCTAATDSWTHRRRKRRHQRKSEDKMDTSELSESLPVCPPVLRVKMSIATDNSDAQKVTIDICQLEPHNTNKFKNWFALINKELQNP